MIGLDFPIRPEWIHDVHALWQPEQPLTDLVGAALAQTMQELGGRTARRKTLTAIVRNFVRIEGRGNSRRTASEDVWVTYSRAFAPSTLAPAYLAHLISQNDVAHHAAGLIGRRSFTGDEVASRTLRQSLIAQFGERKVVTNAGSAFLHTLVYFGVLSRAETQGHFRFAKRLAIPRETFPLIVWSWWQRHLTPQIDVEAFAADPAVAFLQSAAGGLEPYWQTYQPALWVLEERFEGRRATLKHPNAAGFERALIDLVSM